MEDVVAVAVKLEDGTERFFVTWGRIQDPVDPNPLAAVVLEHASGFSLRGKPVAARVCWSLSEARDEPYFYEALLHFAWDPIPYGKGYKARRKKKAKALSLGKELHYLGVREDVPHG